MSSELVEELFTEMVAKTPNQRRELLLAAKYPQAVKDAAARLVQAYESKSPLLNEDLLSDIARIDPNFFGNAGDEAEPTLQPGDQINGYTIEAKLGEGGMSIVYSAIQSLPIRRRVAIKLIRPSVFAPKTVVRFFREQQALALVGHPNIATLYEVGTTPDGHPFAVMEQVNGAPITAFCEQHQLESSQRILLFMNACEGLLHAHRHGIVHRDIKPDNILVGVRDRKPVAKLIDFGIAKIDRGDIKNNATMTQLGQILGSPRYMSPEQFDGKPVDQRSDIYSAALVLFELLTRSPYRKGDTTDELMSQARTPEPERLSRRLKKNINERRHAFGNESPDRLLKLVRRNLDWVMMKALAKEPDRRYSSMLDFIKDLRATLRGQPVSVSAPNAVVRTTRFAQSNRRWIAVSAVVLALAASVFGFVRWQKSELKLSEARRANSTTVKQNAAANDLIMRLLASDMYELTTDQFDLNLIPSYQSQYDEIRRKGGPRTNEDKTVYGILAVLYAMSGDFDQADELMGQVSDDPQESELRVVREKICAEYAAMAKAKLVELEGAGMSFERAVQQMTLGRCYIVWNMLDDAKVLLKEAIAYFDSCDPPCSESLIARVTLAKIYDQAGDKDDRLKLLRESYETYKGNRVLLDTKRGSSAFQQIVDALKVSKVDLDSPPN